MKRVSYFLPALVFYGLIFLVSSQSNLGINLPGHWLDKVPHMLEFTAMGFLLALGFFRAVRSRPILSIALTFFSGALLGGLDEFHQKFVKGRSSDPRDAAADAVGVAAGVVLYLLWRRRQERSRRPSAWPKTPSTGS